MLNDFPTAMKRIIAACVLAQAAEMNRQSAVCGAVTE